MQRSITKSQSQWGVMQQMDLLETETARALLDQLLADSRLYRTGKDYRALLDFVIRLRNFCAVQCNASAGAKPGLDVRSIASGLAGAVQPHSEGRTRPLLILWPFGPVALVYDVADTLGDPCLTVFRAFAAHGAVDSATLAGYASKWPKAHRME